MKKIILLFLFFVSGHLFSQSTTIDVAKLFGIKTGKPFEIVLIQKNNSGTLTYSFFSIQTTKIVNGKSFLKGKDGSVIMEKNIKITINNQNLVLNESGVNMFGTSFNDDIIYLSLKKNIKWGIRKGEFGKYISFNANVTLPSGEIFKNCVIVKSTQKKSRFKRIFHTETYYFYSPIIGYLGKKIQSSSDKSTFKSMEKLEWDEYRKVK